MRSSHVCTFSMNNSLPNSLHFKKKKENFKCTRELSHHVTLTFMILTSFIHPFSSTFDRSIFIHIETCKLMSKIKLFFYYQSFIIDPTTTNKQNIF